MTANQGQQQQQPYNRRNVYTNQQSNPYNQSQGINSSGTGGMSGDNNSLEREPERRASLTPEQQKEIVCEKVLKVARELIPGELKKVLGGVSEQLDMQEKLTKHAKLVRLRCLGPVRSLRLGMFYSRL